MVSIGLFAITGAYFITIYSISHNSLEDLLIDLGLICKCSHVKDVHCFFFFIVIASTPCDCNLFRFIFRKEDGLLRTMNAEKLLKTVPTLQNQLDALLEFDCSANDLTNGVINMCFMLLFRDLIRLFACYNDGIINLLGK